MDTLNRPTVGRGMLLIVFIRVSTKGATLLYFIIMADSGIESSDIDCHDTDTYSSLDSFSYLIVLSIICWCLV